MSAERIDKLKGAVIEEVLVYSPAQVGQSQHGQWQSYSIVIKTDRGEVCISGCHDMSPEVNCETTPIGVDDGGLCPCPLCQERGY